MRQRKVQISPEALEKISCPEDTISDRVLELCRKFYLEKSSYVKVHVSDDKIVILTSYGTLIAPSDLSNAALREGYPVGFSPGANRSGHKLPSSDTRS